MIAAPRRPSLCAVAFAVAMACAAPSAPAQEAGNPASADPAAAAWEPDRASLASFGIDPDIEVTVTRFLVAGIPESARAKGLPPQPRRRLQLFPMVMEVAARRAYDSTRAALLRILSKDYPAGVLRVINEDAMTIPTSQRDAFLVEADRLLRAGAANALSILGERAALPLVWSLHDAEASQLGKIAYALFGATLGDRRFLEPLVAATADADPRVVFAALEALEQVSGESFNADPQAPVARRRESAAKAAAWLASRGRTVTLRHGDVVARRMVPRPPRPLPPTPISTRDHLLFAMLVEEGPRGEHARASRRLLGELPPERLLQLERIALDAHEDIDIRRQAMFWYVQNRRADSRPLMERLAKDEDQPIADAAREYLSRAD